MELLQNVNTARRAAGHVGPRAPPVGSGTTGAGRGTRGQPFSAMPVLHFAPARRRRFVSTLFPLPAPPTGYLPWMGPSAPRRLSPARRLPTPKSPRSENARARPHPPFLSSGPEVPGPPTSKTSLQSGSGGSIPSSPESGGSPGLGRENCPHHVQPAGRPAAPRPAPPPPARPAEPARVARAGGSRPPPSYNSRRRARRVSFSFPP